MHLICKCYRCKEKLTLKQSLITVGYCKDCERHISRIKGALLIVLRERVEYTLNDLHWKVSKVMREKSRKEPKYEMFSHQYDKHWGIALVRLGIIYELYKKMKAYAMDMSVLEYERRFAERHNLTIKRDISEHQLSLSEIGFMKTKEELIRKLELRMK